MHLCFIVEGYPTPRDPFMPFIRELAAEMVDQGVDCTVVAPQSVTRAASHRLPLRPRYWEDKTDQGRTIRVYQPYYFTFSNRFRKLNRFFMAEAIKRTYRRIPKPVDALYAHFWHMGVMASKIRCDLPIFVACGESRIEVRDSSSEREINTLLRRLGGVVYVGTKSFEESKQQKLQNGTPYIIAPNGYAAAKFHKKDKLACRRALGWPEDGFIVLFVGAFNSRKGADRLSEALNGIDETVYSCFIGSGAAEPACDHILYKGKEEHSRIADYLNASDVFVLPTNNEGCCNAIVEATACGVPVISSDQLFNHDILDDTCSIRTDPMDVESIRNAILTLKRDPALREKLAAGALEKARGRDISARAQKIIGFVKKNLG